jgi:hypothetical protein
MVSCSFDSTKMITRSTYALYFLIITEENDHSKYHDLVNTIPLSLRNRLTGIVESLKHIGDSSVVSQFEDQVSDIFALRVQAMNWLATVNNANILESLWQETDDLKRRIEDKELLDRMSRSMEIIEKVTLSISDSSDFKNSLGQFNPASGNALSGTGNQLYNDLPVIFATIGLNPQSVKALMDFIHSSLAVEFALILADLHTLGDVQLRPEILQELSHFLYDSAQKYGAYAIIYKIWNPSSADESNEVVGCKILSQVILLEQGNGITVSLDEILKR